MKIPLILLIASAILLAASFFERFWARTDMQRLRADSSLSSALCTGVLCVALLIDPDRHVVLSGTILVSLLILIGVSARLTLKLFRHARAAKKAVQR